ncbi:MAG: class I SAM-dependent methyltransferase [Elusimicrobiota bacterium]
MKCRHCNADVSLPFIDLGTAPPSNAYLTEITLRAPEKWFPLRVLVCTNCWLVQTEDYSRAEELFSSDYAYFSSYSTIWLEHAKKYTNDMVERFKLDNTSKVVEIAANDGYLLQYFKAKNIPCLGVEPTSGTAAAARAKGIEIIEDFFGAKLAKKMVQQGIQADLIAGNNVLAHVPDINDFVQAFALILKSKGVATFEFPHLLRLIAEKQFDTIYHEHFSYLSLTHLLRIFKHNGLEIFDVEELVTHGGSLRVFAQRLDSSPYEVNQRVKELQEREISAGMTTTAYYSGFQEKANLVKNDLVSFLLEAARSEKKVIAYGAAAKGNTLLNYAGVRTDLIPYVVDRSPSKQGKYMPGSRIPIVDESIIRVEKPEYILILPWNIRTEVMEQLAYIREWGGKFVTAVPSLEVK